MIICRAIWVTRDGGIGVLETLGDLDHGAFGLSLRFIIRVIRVTRFMCNICAAHYA